MRTETTLHSSGRAAGERNIIRPRHLVPLATLAVLAISIVWALNRDLRMTALPLLDNPSAATGGTAEAQAAAKKFVLHEVPKRIAAIHFEDGQGRSRSLADFHGKILLLNIWATWCVPCRKEMPAFDRLQAALRRADFEAVPLSIDRGGMDIVRKFFAEAGIENLAMYLDGSGKAMRELAVVGLPTTLLVDREGHELGRLIGPAEWDTPEMVGFIRCVIAKNATSNPEAGTSRKTTPLCGRGNLDLPTSDTSRNQ